MARIKYTVSGIKEVERNILKSIKGLENNARKGVALAGHKVKTDAQKLTPIDTGELIESSYMIELINVKNPTVVVGYKDEKARIVHEMPDSTNWQRAGASNKFLHKAVFENLANIKNIITRIVKRGLKK